MTKNSQNLTPFILLCLIGFAAFFSSYLRLPVMPLFAATLGASPAQVGSINGAFMLTAGLLSIPAGLLAGSTVMGLALKQIGYPTGFAAAGCMALVTLLVFFPMMRKNQLIMAD